ncbi:MAG: hypothetical protein PF503_17490 [Desulfobacula sp.]|nr:hypothetical protein [Desulfobacula sp.]
MNKNPMISNDVKRVRTKMIRIYPVFVRALLLGQIRNKCEIDKIFPTSIPSPIQIMIMVLFEKIERSPEIDMNAELPKTNTKLNVIKTGYIFPPFY